MKNNFLVTRPDHDLTTNYLHYFAGLVIKTAIKKGTTVIDLKGKRANKKEFVSIVRETQPALIFLNGHGNSRAVGGYNDEALVRSHENEILLRGRIVYALSCCSARDLGKNCVRTGTKAYLGYDDDFIFLFEENKVTQPLDDQTARMFLEPSNLIITSLLKGQTPSTSWGRSQEAFRKNIRKFLTSESPKEEKELIPYIMWDLNHQVCLGDKECKFS